MDTWKEYQDDYNQYERERERKQSLFQAVLRQRTGQSIRSRFPMRLFRILELRESLCRWDFLREWALHLLAVILVHQVLLQVHHQKRRNTKDHLKKTARYRTHF